MCFNYTGVIQTWCKENAVMNLHSLWPLDVVHVQSYWCSAFPSGVPRAAKALAMGLCFFSSSHQMCPLVIKLTCNEAICRCCFKCKGCCIPQWVRASLLEMVKGCLNSILEIHDNWGLNFLWNNFSHPYGCYRFRAPGSPCFQIPEQLNIRDIYTHSIWSATSVHALIHAAHFKLLSWIALCCWKVHVMLGDHGTVRLKGVVICRIQIQFWEEALEGITLRVAQWNTWKT